MSKYTAIILSIVTLAGVTIGLLLWVGAFNRAVHTYRSPIAGVDLPVQLPATPQTDKVVLVLISGLGYDDSFIVPMPTLQRLRQIGADAAIQSTPPTYALTSWATILSGATSEINDAPLLDRPPDEIELLTTDTIFSRAAEAQQRTALLGPEHWRRLLPRNHLDYTLFMDAPGPQADALIYEAALPLIRDNQANLILIHFTQLDVAAQEQGGTEDEAYQEAATQIDAYLEEISAATNLNSTTLIILSDHGHLAEGGFGGNEAEVIWQPFIMTGDPVIPGTYSDIYQTDLAPTVATLLGLAPPRAARGRILFEMFEIGEYERSFSQLSLAQQRIALTKAYLAAIGSEDATLTEPLDVDFGRAQGAFDIDNLSGAYQLALLTQEEADQLMTTTRQSFIRREEVWRIAGSLLFLLVWFTMMWRRRGYHAATIVVAAVITIALYHTLYQLQGYSYSVSAIADIASLPADTARRTAVSFLVGGGVLLAFLMLTKEEKWQNLLGAGYGFAVLVTFAFLLPFFWGYWQNGLVPRWYLPNIVAVFWQVTAAFEALTVASLGLVLPWPMMIFCHLVNVVRRSMTRQQPEPDVLPGLRL